MPRDPTVPVAPDPAVALPSPHESLPAHAAAGAVGPRRVAAGVEEPSISAAWDESSVDPAWPHELHPWYAERGGELRGRT